MMSGIEASWDARRRFAGVPPESGQDDNKE